ncbi:MAG TPA: 16S rRNA (adenine(1518)-N(6)/adenine(1519)-N(6))-dimethyltransferase RsmA [Methanosarcinales archaeon]|nr:16S rRNA (adenine(1518)-N(6)/adenine(1519)-N(6))-dimethyltransferase RsmA [Methanosarcinales archaeon]
MNSPKPGKSGKTYISSPSKTAEILNLHNIRLKKSLGQNFLIDTNILKKIAVAAELKPEDIVLEIGSGIGSLTEIMLPQIKKIICIEVDNRLVQAFKEIFRSCLSSQIDLIESDAMKLDYRELKIRTGVTKVVSNLPYKIAAPLILKIMLEAPEIEHYCLTIQRDIADRLTAKKGDKNYSSYAVKANFLADFKILFPVSRSCFIPVPFVDSVVVKAGRKTSKKTAGINTPDFFGFVEDCFLHRRKKLINSLLTSNEHKYVDKINLIIKMLHGIGKDKNLRAEDLRLDDFLFLYRSLKAN